MPCPYSIIFGRDTALPSPLYHSGAAGIDITTEIWFGIQNSIYC